jgi:uncharacterized membrane protein YagU involved in acid resistance
LHQKNLLFFSLLFSLPCIRIRYPISISWQPKLRQYLCSTTLVTLSSPRTLRSDLAKQNCCSFPYLYINHLIHRVVLMTALSFVLGVLPLVFASGAGAASRVSLGVTVLFGMVAATILGTLLIPVFYKWIQSARDRFKGATAQTGSSNS